MLRFEVTEVDADLFSVTKSNVVIDLTRRRKLQCAPSTGSERTSF